MPNYSIRIHQEASGLVRSFEASYPDLLEAVTQQLAMKTDRQLQDMFKIAGGEYEDRYCPACLRQYDEYEDEIIGDYSIVSIELIP